MTNRISELAIKTLALSVVAGVAALVAPSMTRAQCRPDDVFCAELRIGPAAPPPVIVQPPPPPPPPPPVIVRPAPQPPVVIVQPAQPPQQVVVRPRRRVVNVQIEREREYELTPDGDFGLHFGLGGSMTANAPMAGAFGGFRLRPIDHLAVDLTAGIYGGESWNYGSRSGGPRWEVPLQADLLVFVNPQHRFQFYFIGGVGASFAGQEYSNYTLDARSIPRASIARYRYREMAYLGGELGIGLEWRLTRRFALNTELRGFLRVLIDDGNGPEFERVSGGAVESTNLSGGGYGTIGMTFYLGD